MGDSSFLVPDPNRFTLFPIKHLDIYEFYKKARSCFWSPEEVDMITDIKHFYKNLSENDRYFIKHILAFFAASDGIVIENLAERFLTECQSAEVRAFYTYQIFTEQIHSEMYSIMIEALVKDEKEKSDLFDAVLSVHSIKKKGDWAQKWIADKSSSFGTRLAAFAIVEGVFFSGAFCAIYWIKKRGYMPGLCMSNEFISRDEALHTEFACLLFHKLKEEDRPSTEEVETMMREAVAVEKEFITESFSARLIGMNNILMSEYIEFVADRLLVELGCNKIFRTENPFDWMELISLEGKTNFFEKRVTEYSKAPGKQGIGFSLEEDF